MMRAAVRAWQPAAKPMAGMRCVRPPLRMVLRNAGPRWGGVREFRATAAALGKIPFNLADIGEGIKECEVIQWFVKPGDEVRQMDPICEVSSDKATVEVGSRYDGKIVSVEWQEGDMAQVGSPLVWMEVEGATHEEAPEDGSSGAAADPPQDAAVEIARPPPILEREGSFSVDPVLTPTREESVYLPPPKPVALAGDKVLATPAVRRLARDHDLDLRTVPGTAKHGRVTKGDVLAYIKAVPAEERRRQSAEARAGEDGQNELDRAEPAPPSAAAGAAPAAARVAAPSRLAGDVVVPIRGIQRAMVKSMQESLKIPHFNFMEEYEMTRLAEFRAELRGAAEERGVRLSYMPILIKAASLSLIRFPALNAHINAEATEVTHKAGHNIGVAMDTPRGLLVPVIKDVQDKSILDVAQDLMTLQALGQDNKLGEGELTGATFTLSNIGTIGGTYTSPVIPAPTQVIGALGKIRTLPRFIDEEDPDAGVRAVKVMNISWAADHRSVDGATVARFSNELKRYIETPSAFVGALR